MRPNHNHRRPQHSHRPHASVGRSISSSEKDFLAGTPIDPTPRLYLDKGHQALTMRAMDLVCPIGMGQRGLIVAPPGSGKTTLLKDVCKSISLGYPDIKLFCVLIDERPEEVTDFKRQVGCEVRASSSDQTYEHHVETADRVMAEAFDLASKGGNVMIVIDSLTRLSRVHNAQRSSSGRTLSGGVDARALEVPRRIFGAARKIENGGSLTILATILVETGSRMDEVIFEEFKGTGNMEIVLSRDISQHRFYPAIDINQSRTRKEELLLSEAELKSTHAFRQKLAGLNKLEAAKFLIETIQKYPTNAQLLAQY